MNETTAIRTDVQPLHIARTETNYTTRRPCFLCGGATFKTDRPFEIYSQDNREFVCEECVHAEPAERIARALEEVHALEWRARSLRQCAEVMARVTPIVDHAGCEEKITAGSWCQSNRPKECGCEGGYWCPSHRWQAEPF
jgi:hypothetical protein